MFKPSQMSYDILLNTRSSGSTQTGSTGPTGSTGSVGPRGPTASGVQFSRVINQSSSLESTQYVALTIGATTYNVILVNP